MNTLHGYYYFYDPKHPLANKTGTVYLHRHVASIKVGHWLNADEHVHHINGDKKNNHVNNLMVLSPVEHARLEKLNQYAGKEKIVLYCSKCGKQIYSPNKENIKMLCLLCSSYDRRKFNISKEELEKLLWEIPTTKIAQIYGVSDKAIDKRSKIFGLSKPPRGYWAKIKYKKNS